MIYDMAKFFSLSNFYFLADFKDDLIKKFKLTKKLFLLSKFLSLFKLQYVLQLFYPQIVTILQKSNKTSLYLKNKWVFLLTSLLLWECFVNLKSVILALRHFWHSQNKKMKWQKTTSKCLRPTQTASNIRKSSKQEKCKKARKENIIFWSLPSLFWNKLHFFRVCSMLLFLHTSTLR